MSRLISIRSLIGFFLIIASLSFSRIGLAQTSKTNQVDLSQRWLLVVDFSKPMERRAAGIGEVVQELVLSGMHGQMQPGDSLGVWTYDSSLHTGEFPLQRWTKEENETIARTVLSFLQSQQFTADDHFDEVMPQVNRIIRASSFITVILVSDGGSQIYSTPFDDKINASYQSWQKEQQNGKMPFVTLLRGSMGEIIQYAVSTPPWPLEIPAPSRELLEARAKAAQANIRVVPPLIVSGKKPQTNSIADSESATNSAMSTESPAQNSKPAAAIPAPAQTATGTTSVAGSVVSEKTNRPTTIASVESNHGTPGKTPASQLDKSAAGPGKVTSTIINPPGESQSSPRLKNILIFGGAGAAILVFFLIVIARARNRDHASIITLSLDRDKE
jgi:hypothetical protein